MQLPKLFQGDSLTRLAQSAAVGAVATMMIGFNWGDGFSAKPLKKRNEACKCRIGASLWACVYRKI